MMEALKPQRIGVLGEAGPHSKIAILNILNNEIKPQILVNGK
jgi:hypothetical protein